MPQQTQTQIITIIFLREIYFFLCSCVLLKCQPLAQFSFPTALASGIMATGPQPEPRIVAFESRLLGIRCTMQLDGPELVKIYWKNNEGREMLVYSSDNAETIPCMREMQLNAEEFEQCLAFFWWNMYILFF